MCAKTRSVFFFFIILFPVDVRTTLIFGIEFQILISNINLLSFSVKISVKISTKSRQIK